MRYTVALVVIGLFVVWSLLLIVYGVPQPKPASYVELTSQWAMALYNYQSLIGGVLAIAAALMTIYQMRSDENSAKDRHTEMMELQMRRDRLLIDRATDPQLEDLRENSEEVDALYGIAMSGDLLRSINRNKADVRRVLKRAYEIVQRDTIAQAESLYDGDMTYALARIKDACIRLAALITDDFPATDAQKIQNAITDLNEYQQRFIGGLGRLEKQYVFWASGKK